MLPMRRGVTYLSTPNDPGQCVGTEPSILPTGSGVGGNLPQAEQL